MPIRHSHGCKHAVILCLLLIGQGCAQLFRLANNVFSDNMVLQMEPKRAHIWGYGTVGARIEITMDSGDSIATTFVQSDAKWIAQLPPQPPGGPHLIAVEQTTLLKQEAKAIALLQDVVFGDVWVCAGEGNMELAMRNIFNATQEMEAALAYTNIRVMQIKQHASSAELDELQGVMLPWGSLTREIVGDFPALCLLYGERMSDALSDRPIGLVAMTWQNTPIEAWVSRNVTNHCQTPATPGEIDQTSNNAIWNGMVRPLSYTAIQGVIWSQGESNVKYNLPLYACHLLHLTRTWQESFADGDVPINDNGWSFPFGIVQSGTMEYEDDEAVTLLRYHQTLNTQVIPNSAANETFMAPTYDLHDATSPFGSEYFRDKQTVATRLSRAARRLIYNEMQLHFMGPMGSLVWDPETSIMNTSYSSEVRFLNRIGEPSGFYYQMPTKEWVSAPLENIFEDTFTFWVHPNYTHIAYAWNSRPCDYMRCNVYSDREDALPHITTLFPQWSDPPQ